MKEKKRILIIEDEASIVSLLKENLKQKYLTAVARNGKTGLTKAWANSFDLILLDIELGDIDGFTICKKLKKHPSTAMVPVIIVSARDNVESTVEGFQSGASDYIHKPFHAEELHKRIEVHLKMSDMNRRLRSQATATQKSKIEFSQFISSLAHELRSPLNSIIGFSEILNDPQLSQEDRQNFLRFINQGGHNLLKLLNDLIDYSKIEAETLSIHFSKVNIGKELQELTTHFNDDLIKNDIKNKQVSLVSPDNTDDVIVLTDIVRFIQIIRNFIDNALKYTNEGEIKIGYKLLEKNQLKVFVQDQGIGMSNEVMQSLFKVGSYGSGLIQIKKAGKGLGLAVSYKLSKLIGGQLDVQSTEGQGSIFSIIIPCNFMDNQDIPKAQDVQKYRWDNKLLLIAEDVMVNYLFYVALLKKTNVNIIHAKNGLEVLDLLENHSPDLILMDMIMPKMDGLEATVQVRKYYPQIPIIAQSSIASYDDKEAIYRAGCNDIITKPIKPHLLLNKINRFFE